MVNFNRPVTRQVPGVQSQVNVNQFKNAHAAADTDQSKNAIHHTIGTGANQAASGAKVAELISAVGGTSELGDKINGVLSKAVNTPVGILFLGSSTTEGIAGTTSPENRYVNRMAAMIQASYPQAKVHGFEAPVNTHVTAQPVTGGCNIVNGGIGGTFSNGYVTSAVQTFINTYQPDIIIHMIGSNDYSWSINPETFKTNLRASINLCRGLLTKPAVHLICSTFARFDVTSPTVSWDDYATKMEELADESSDAYYVDVLTPFKNVGSSYPGLDPLDLISTDNVHPTDRGQSFIAEVIGKALRLPPAMKTLPPEVYDNFSRPALNAEWIAQAGSFVPTPSGLSITSGGNLVVNTNFSDAEISAVVKIDTTLVPGLILKSADSTTRLGFFANGPSNRWEMYRGSTILGWTTLEPSLVNGRDYIMALRIKGNNMAGYVNGKRVLNLTLAPSDVTAYAGNTHHGVRCSGANANLRWKNLTIRPL